MHAFTFHRSTDWPLIRRMMTHPRVWPHISDDFAPAPAEFAPADNPGFCYVMVEDGDTPIGLFLLQAHNGCHVEVHTCLLPAGWVRGSREIARQAVAWLWPNCPQIERLTTTVPQNNLLALRFAQAMGMIEYGVNPKSRKKNGVLVDQTLLGMNRPSRMPGDA